MTDLKTLIETLAPDLHPRPRIVYQFATDMAAELPWRVTIFEGADLTRAKPYVVERVIGFNGAFIVQHRTKLEAMEEASGMIRRYVFERLKRGSLTNEQAGQILTNARITESEFEPVDA